MAMQMPAHADAPRARAVSAGRTPIQECVKDRSCCRDQAHVLAMWDAQSRTIARLQGEISELRAQLRNRAAP